MDISLYDYHLPSELIAQFPLQERAESRMLILEKESGRFADSQFSEFADKLNSGDCLVLNDTCVFPARLQQGKRLSGGAVEIFLVRREAPVNEADAECHWRALAKPGGRLKEGEEIVFGDDDSSTLRLVSKLADGAWEIAFASQESERDIISLFGSAPLPPYIQRAPDITDLTRYQTVFADKKKSGAVAAPTAGLHFTDMVLAALVDKGVSIAKITLHVGPGTFKPVQVQNIEDHQVDPEWAEISVESGATINSTIARGGKIVAVGTTVTRTLEFVARQVRAGNTEAGVEEFSGMVDLYIRPGFEFRIVDSLLTNFHLPKSSLLILVAALAGRDIVLRAYEHAIAEQYRYYSYGDCMFIR
jgi:S-adenosylmethionine:tRNA ribosyltransferase-isomerase